MTSHVKKLHRIWIIFLPILLFSTQHAFAGFRMIFVECGSNHQPLGMTLQADPNSTEMEENLTISAVNFVNDRGVATSLSDETFRKLQAQVFNPDTCNTCPELQEAGLCKDKADTEDLEEGEEITADSDVTYIIETKDEGGCAESCKNAYSNSQLFCSDILIAVNNDYCVCCCAEPLGVEKLGPGHEGYIPKDPTTGVWVQSTRYGACGAHPAYKPKGK